MRRLGAIGGLALLLLGAPARGELVYFARGGQVQIPATIEADSVRLDAPGGAVTIPRSEILKVVPGHHPAGEWPALRDSAAQDGSAGARFAAAWWALENGLTPEAVATLAEARPVAPGHGPTRRCLEALGRLARPRPDPDLGPLRRRLRPSAFRELRGEHVVLLHQADERDARDRLDVLERVVVTFHLTLAAQGIELDPPRERLVSVWFADRSDYADLLRRADAGPFAESQGYYHPTLGAVFAYDARGGEPQRTARRALANRRKDDPADPDLARRSLLLDLEWRATDLGIAAHETVHQLTVASGLARRFDNFPSWLHEGLAAQFEVVRGGRWAGVGRAHDLRLPAWRSIRPAPRLAPLLADPGLGQGYRGDLYAESWALVYFLRKDRPDGFRTFLDLLRIPPPGDSPRPDRAAVAFRAAFGDDLPAIESAWHRHLRGVDTPLEAGRPAGAESRLAAPGPGH